MASLSLSLSLMDSQINVYLWPPFSIYTSDSGSTEDIPLEIDS